MTDQVDWIKVDDFGEYTLWKQWYDGIYIYNCCKGKPTPLDGGYYRASTALSRKGL